MTQSPYQGSSAPSPRLRRTVTVLVILLSLVLVAAFARVLLDPPTCPAGPDGTAPRATWSWRTTDGWQCPADEGTGVRA